MKRKLAPILLAGAGMIACSGAFAWSSVGDKIKLTPAELTFCRTWESDAAAVMYARQFGSSTPTYPNDTAVDPTDFDKRKRQYFIREALNYQIAETEKEKMSAAEAFSVQMRNRCFGVVTSTPSTKEAQ